MWGPRPPVSLDVRPMPAAQWSLPLVRGATALQLPAPAWPVPACGPRPGAVLPETDFSLRQRR